MNSRRVLIFCLFAFLFVFCEKSPDSEKIQIKNKYEDLLSFFKEWREFQKPEMINGIPDYTKQAMTEQKRQIPEFKNRLAEIDTSGWPIPYKVDYDIIRAEINGLEFEHRVLRSWARNPIFYAVIQMYEPDVPSREGPEIYGVLNVFKHEFPLNDKSQKIFKEKLSVIPDILEQAKLNLTEDAGDLWLFGIQKKKRESSSLAILADRLENDNPDLAQLARTAKTAVDDFTVWLEEKHKGMKAYSGIGAEEFSRYMKEVHLVPYNWKEQVDMMERELERSLAGLAMEEHRNRRLPELKPAASLEEMQNLMKTSVAEFMAFLKNEEIFEVTDYMHLDDEVSSYTPPERLDFFSHIN